MDPYPKERTASLLQFHRALLWMISDVHPCAESAVSAGMCDIFLFKDESMEKNNELYNIPRSIMVYFYFVFWFSHL